MVKYLKKPLSYVNEQDNEGVPDLLKLRDFSHMSLLHTLRVRYVRDNIYTFVGTILISVNPYKSIKDLYSEKVLIDYHNNISQVHYYIILLLVFYC